MLRITADTNVIISALNFSGNPARILEMAAAGQIHLATSDDILDEVEGVLLRPKFGWTMEQVDGVIRGLMAFSEHVQPTQRINVITEDPTDNRIVECAAASGSDYLVSGDKHLLALKQYQSVKVVTPADFVSMFAGRGQRI